MQPASDVRKLVLPGGSGHLGQLLARHHIALGNEVTVLGRGAAPALPEGVRYARWDGRNQGPWSAEIDGADAVINLAGRSVDCTYNKTNLEEMLSSRIDSTVAIGEAIAAADRPPATWLQMSTATIYSHRFDGPNDEPSGVLGGSEPGVPSYWRYSVHIAQAWERCLAEAATPRTRKVALRTAMVMSAAPGGPFRVLRRLARLGLGGPVAGGDMYMSWIHEDDFVRATDHLLQDANISGPVNLAAPAPLPQREFMAALRQAVRMPLGLPAFRWMVRLGALALRTDPELILKSRRVTPARLLASGFDFQYPSWPHAAEELAQRPA